jgi:UDP-N-acetylglucosamine 1-carboxyvinyltransferase
MVVERFFVEGGNRLYGEVKVSGAKNAALKMIAAALLAPGRTTLRNVPRIRDVETMLAVLDGLGVEGGLRGQLPDRRRWRGLLLHRPLRPRAPDAGSYRRLWGRSSPRFGEAEVSAPRRLQPRPQEVQLPPRLACARSARR